MATTTDNAYQRAGPLARLAEVVRELGTPPSAVTRATGVDIERLTSESRLPLPLAITVLEQAAVLTDCPHLGLLAGARHCWRDHGPILDYARHAPTLGQALVDFAAFQLGYSNGATVYLNRIGTDFAFGYGLYDRASPGSRQLYELSAAVGFTMVRGLTGGAVTPAEILFPFRAPDDLSVHRRILPVPLRFNQAQLCLVLPSAALDTPLPEADRRERDRLRRNLAAVVSHGAGSVSARLRHVVLPQLHDDDPSMLGAAVRLGLHPRTLRRQLASEGTTFEAVRDDVRLVLARELLDLTDLPVGDISAALAFATHAAFDRAFLRWTGLTPSAWRRRTTSPAGPARPRRPSRAA